MAEKEIKVVGMHCPSCVNAVELCLKDVDGIEDFCDEKYPRTSDYMKKHITDEIRRAFNRMTGKYFEAKKMPKEYLKFIK